MVAAGLLLWLATPLGLDGFNLDRELSVLSGSRLPSPLEPGDRVAQIGGQAVNSPRELAAVLTRTPSSSVDVAVELRGRMRTVTLSQLRMETDPPADLLSAERVVRVDSEAIDGAMPVSELHQYLERAAPTPIEVEYELKRTEMAGTAVIKSRSQSPIVLAWLALGLLGVVGVTLLQSQRLSRWDVGILPLATVCAGALAMAGLTANVVGEGVNPGFALWATTLFVVWRAVEVGARSSRGGSSVAVVLLGAPALVAFGGAAFVSVTSMGQDNIASWLEQIDHFAVAAFALALGYLAGTSWRYPSPSRRAAMGEWGAVGLAIGVAAVLGLVVGESTTDSVVWGMLAAGGVLWPMDIAGVLHVGGEGTQRTAAVSTGAGLADGLARLRETTDEEEITYAFVGIGEDFVAVTLDDPTGMGDLTVVSVDAKPEVAAALSMLALEGGMFPRPLQLGGHGDDNDPFAELRVRLGFEAIVPVGARSRRAGVSTFAAALRRDASGMGATFALETFIETVEEIDSPVFVSELIAMGSEAILRRARRAIKEAGKTARESAPPRRRESAQPAPRPTQSAVPSAPQAWLNHLTDELRRAYPVDDPDALDDREWLALAFLRESIKPALIIGEPSSGKEFLARAVHEAMWGEDRRFATVDCALRPPSIIEVELFGDDEEPGLLSAIGKGTLLLKGASALGQSTLANLVPRLCRSECRVVFAERYKGISDGIPSSVDPTIVKFCDDRNIHLSPLRERSPDIPRFVQYFLHKAAMKYDVMVMTVAPDALAFLAGLELAGNFLELEARVSAAVLRATSETVELADFGAENPPVASEPPLPAVAGAASPSATDAIEQASAPGTNSGPRSSTQALAEGPTTTGAQTELSLPRASGSADDEEKALIVAALGSVDGNRTQAAASLGYTRGKLLRRMKKYGLS